MARRMVLLYSCRIFFPRVSANTETKKKNYKKLRTFFPNNLGFPTLNSRIDSLTCVCLDDGSPCVGLAWPTV